jgi:hypothetical protein
MEKYGGRKKIPDVKNGGGVVKIKNQRKIRNPPFE